MWTAVIVDDSTELRGLTRLCLELEGGTTVVGEAGDGAEALHVITALRPDIAVLDLHMPGITGVDAIRQLRREGCTARLVAYSSDTKALDDALDAGADATVIKSGDMRPLLIAISPGA